MSAHKGLQVTARDVESTGAQQTAVLFNECVAERDEARAQRDELAAILRKVMTYAVPNYSMLTDDGRAADDQARKLLEQFARAAIAKVQP